MRLLVKEILVGEDTITFRHSIPIPSAPLQNGGSEALNSPNYVLCKGRGQPVSPIPVNLFMHYTFDLWMARTHPDLPWCRCADDGLVHCRTEQQAEALKAELHARLMECHLEMHRTKTKVVYCKDGKRKGKYPNVKFDFLWAFGPVWCDVPK